MFDSIIDPTVSPNGEAGPSPLVLAGRPAELSGLRLGLLANVKRNAAEFLDSIGQVLARDYGVSVTVTETKADIVTTMPGHILAKLVAGCDIAVVGVGDCGTCSASAIGDGILLERNGTPAVVLVTDAFTVGADAMAALSGAPGYRYVSVPHPIANLTPDGIRAGAEAAAPATAGLLTRSVTAVSP